MVKQKCNVFIEAVLVAFVLTTIQERDIVHNLYVK